MFGIIKNYINMKTKNSILFLLIISLVNTIYAQTADYAIVNVFRPWRYTGALSILKVYIDDREVCEIGNREKAQIKVTASETIKISAKWKFRGESYRKRTEKSIYIENGKTYYIKLDANDPAGGVIDIFDQNKGREKFDKIPEDNLITAEYYAKNIKQKKPEIIDNKPQISIFYPKISRGFKTIEKSKQTTIIGKATDDNGIYEVLINGQEVIVDAQGNFTKTVLLAVGDNTFAVTATDTKQNTAIETFVIERQAIQQTVLQDDVIVNNSTNILSNGKYYALIIGNNNYKDPAITSLDEPINDATKLYNVLTTKYTFKPQNVTFLKNASYVQMIEAFDNLSNNITENDNLLVFYAGHGWWDDKKELGYWLPTDAKQSSTAFWIANSRISDYMSSIETKHTLLIADACFSGSIFKKRAAFTDAGQAINSLYELPSRTAMTSGNLKEVPDKSVFLEYLVKRLDNNTKKYLSSDQLFVSFRIAVMNNSKTEPQFGTIQNAGDEGGEFIFIRR